MPWLVASIGQADPTSLGEVARLGPALTTLRDDVLAFFDHTKTGNGSTETINGRCEHLRGSALGFRNLTHYTARSLLEADGFKPHLHSRL